MTDKQIIIDGVDVSGCCHQGKNETCTCPHYKNECTRNPNCHYKIIERQVKKLDKFHKRNLELEQQLKRKEQECDKLKLDLIEAKAHGDYLNNLALSETLNLVSEQLDQLKAENKQLKKQIESDKGLITDAGKQNYQLIQEYDRLKVETEELRKQYNCYACDTCKGKEDYINLKRHCENAIKSLHNKHAELDQLKADTEELKKVNEVKNELLAKFGCPTTATAKMKAHCSQEQLNRLKAENEKLKANNEKWKTVDITLNNGSIKTQISDMSLAEYSQVKLERDKAEQKLTEIKEIAEYEFKELMNAEDYHNMTEVLKQILQKIGEVE